MMGAYKVPFSVLLSVYNNESSENLISSLESVLVNQSVLPDQVVLVVDGYICEELDNIIEEFKTSFENLHIIRLKLNKGLANALNEGLKYCDHELVFRMDTDDISLPNRFETQLEFMTLNDDIAVCGSYVLEFDENEDDIISTRKVPLSHEEIIKFCKYRNPMSHPSVCFRKSAVLDSGSYPLLYPEDYLLWIKMIMAGFRFANIPSFLLKMRTNNAFIERRGFEFLLGELKIYFFLYKIGWISIIHLVRVTLQRAFLRLAPSFIKIWLYRNMR
tara:strand:- start:1728 stop:2549 length:822 start_codon:yes stop_codon:yes gene_type:complete